jgi:multicomponent Na+:H+ antiporter subunit D
VIPDYAALARAHAPLLVIAVPVIGAAAAVAVGQARLAWAVAVAAQLCAAALAIDLAYRQLLVAPQAAMNEGVGLSLDPVGAYAIALLTTTALLATVAAGALLRDFGPRAALALAALLIANAGWNGALLARDFVGLFAGIETAWLAGVGLVALSVESGRAALNGAARMFVAGGAASALLLFGAGLLMCTIGATDLSVLGGAWSGSATAAAAGVALMAIALATFAGVAPLHAWAPLSFAKGSAIGAMCVGAVGCVGALAVLARIAALADASTDIGGGVALALSVLGGLSVLIGSVQAIGATNVRRLAAYAASAQAGCVLMAIALGSPAAFEAVFVQIFALAASVLALVGAAAVAGGDTLSSLDGLGRRAPLASLAITAAALSLMGAPLSIGFLGRWRMIEAALGVSWWWAAGAAIAASLAGVFYGGRLIERLYFRRAKETMPASSDMWRFALAPALLSAIAAIALGLEPDILLRAAQSASLLVLGRAE